eukprot:TRINITY_DN1742_c1_g1_i2.p1 TRINITY_DN1742_c1_g1~~TRINITY_DN1742_c1_g1_i2.p1  ORF type:complete len:517 (-),score=145.32 TRINITY_DN1742_c1_g1_i2:2346-3896(-)
MAGNLDMALEDVILKGKKGGAVKNGKGGGKGGGKGKNGGPSKKRAQKADGGKAVVRQKIGKMAQTMSRQSRRSNTSGFLALAVRAAKKTAPKKNGGKGKGQTQTKKAAKSTAPKAPAKAARTEDKIHMALEDVIKVQVVKKKKAPKAEVGKKKNGKVAGKKAIGTKKGSGKGKGKGKGTAKKTQGGKFLQKVKAKRASAKAGKGKGKGKGKGSGKSRDSRKGSGKKGWGKSSRNDGWGSGRDDGWGKGGRSKGWGKSSRDEDWGRGGRNDGWGSSRRSDDWDRDSRIDSWGSKNGRGYESSWGKGSSKGSGRDRVYDRRDSWDSVEESRWARSRIEERSPPARRAGGAKRDFGALFEAETKRQKTDFGGRGPAWHHDDDRARDRWPSSGAPPPRSHGGAESGDRWSNEGSRTLGGSTRERTTTYSGDSCRFLRCLWWWMGAFATGQYSHTVKISLRNVRAVVNMCAASNVPQIRLCEEPWTQATTYFRCVFLLDPGDLFCDNEHLTRRMPSAASIQ